MGATVQTKAERLWEAKQWPSGEATVGRVGWDWEQTIGMISLSAAMVVAEWLNGESFQSGAEVTSGKVQGDWSIPEARTLLVCVRTRMGLRNYTSEDEHTKRLGTIASLLECRIRAAEGRRGGGGE